MNVVEKSIRFATMMHAGQVRKYTGEEYIWHPLEVARIVMSVTDDKEMIAAAILHDTVEDTDACEEDIYVNFGERVASLVMDLTDVSKPRDGNRARRKAIDLAHTEQAHPHAKTIKLADLISNTKSISKHDKEFAKVYLKEKEALLEVLQEGNPILYRNAVKVLEGAKGCLK